MGMPKGSNWKRLAIFSDVSNNAIAPDIAHLLWANRIEYEWWQRTVPAAHGPGTARNQVSNLGRDVHPNGEEWLMVRRGDWPMAFVLAKALGVSL